MPEAARRAALESSLLAYERGDFFEAHELLEPAWMGSADIAERELYQGLIKLAAGYVHCVRGNPIGMARNLEGAIAHVATARDLRESVGADAGIDTARLLDDMADSRRAAQEVVEVILENPRIMIELAEAAPPVRVERSPSRA